MNDFDSDSLWVQIACIECGKLRAILVNNSTDNDTKDSCNNKY